MVGSRSLPCHSGRGRALRRALVSMPLGMIWLGMPGSSRFRAFCMAEGLTKMAWLMLARYRRR